MQGEQEFYLRTVIFLLWMRDLSSEVNAYFLRKVLEDTVSQQIKSLTNGAAYNALTTRKAKKLKIPLPPLKNPKQIAAQIEEEQSSLRQIKTH